MVYDLGLKDQLYGVTHECDYPPEARDKPHVVHSVFEGTQPTSGEISRVIAERLAEGLGIYDIDEELLKAAKPDLLITQAICEV
jgi:iron complex transport system substrate-binding protein